MFRLQKRDLAWRYSLPMHQRDWGCEKWPARLLVRTPIRLCCQALPHLPLLGLIRICCVRCSNASYFGALAFLLNAAFSLIGWRAYRYEVTEMIGFERNLLPPQCSRNRSGNNGSSDTATLCCRRRRRCCRNCKGCCCCECAAVDWLGLAAIIFLAGAAADLVDEFITDPSAQAWVSTETECMPLVHKTFALSFLIAVIFA